MEMTEKDMDKRPLEPFIPIPRQIGGPIRTGYVPFRLFVIMQLMALVAWLFVLFFELYVQYQSQ